MRHALSLENPGSTALRGTPWGRQDSATPSPQLRYVSQAGAAAPAAPSSLHRAFHSSTWLSPLHPAFRPGLLQKCIWNLHAADPPGFGARAAYLQVCYRSLHSTGLLLHSCSASSHFVITKMLFKQLSWVNWSVTLLNENYLINALFCIEYTISTAFNLCCYFCASKHEKVPHAFRMLLFNAKFLIYMKSIYKPSLFCFSPSFIAFKHITWIFIIIFTSIILIFNVMFN